MNLLSKIFLLVACGLLQSCHILFNFDSNLSQDPCSFNIMKQVYQLNHDVFLIESNKDRPLFDHHFSPSTFLYLVIPGQSYLPYSVMAYENDPKGWQFSDKWALKGYPSKDRTANIKDIIRTGTLIKVVKVWYGGSYFCGKTVIVKILNGEWKDCLAEASALFLLDEIIQHNSNWLDKID